MIRRLLLTGAITAGLALPIGGAVMATATTAGAASSITCTSLKGTISSTVTVSKCTPSGGKGYKSASGPAASLAAGGNITWSKSGATTTIGDATVSGGSSQGSCKKNNDEYTFTGTVTAASTSGTGIPAVGDSVSASACVSSKNGKISLAPGTTMKL